MSLMTWSENYSVKINEVDGQHQELFELTNALHESLSGDRAVIGEKLSNLINYVVKHFATEEELMQANGYPDYEAHKKAHDNLVQTCVELQDKFNAGEAEITEETTAFVRDWLYSHIPNIDQQYSPFLNEKGVQ
ncbi:bacteriohemerythrin [Bacillus tuaregi]|uniref:bacteriohemerythrin n=1 Tax=Bacillus tuaregi TaxID=1816695 RepID=UPI0008F7E7F2|nr:bacteriohemerythrin [Bacillus tuaregi]